MIGRSAWRRDHGLRVAPVAIPPNRENRVRFLEARDRRAVSPIRSVSCLSRWTGACSETLEVRLAYLASSSRTRSSVARILVSVLALGAAVGCAMPTTGDQGGAVQSNDRTSSSVTSSPFKRA